MKIFSICILIVIITNFVNINFLIANEYTVEVAAHFTVYDEDVRDYHLFIHSETFDTLEKAKEAAFNNFLERANSAADDFAKALDKEFVGTDHYFYVDTIRINGEVAVNDSDNSDDLDDWDDEYSGVPYP